MVTDNTNEETKEDDELFIARRSLVQKLKLDVHIAQILERLLVRAKSLDSLLKEDLELSTKLQNLHSSSGSYEMETVLEQRLSNIEKERRMEDRMCWLDLTHTMRDFLSVLEALEHSKAREKLLAFEDATETNQKDREDGE